MGQMEIRIILDRAEPPACRLRAVPDPGHCHVGQDEEIRFTGWLGLLRALYEVTGGSGAGLFRCPNPRGPLPWDAAGTTRGTLLG